MDHSTPTFPEKTYPDVLTPCEKRQFRDLLSHFQGKRSMIQHLRMTTVVLRVDLEEKRQGEDIRRTSTIAHPKAPNLTVVFFLCAHEDISRHGELEKGLDRSRGDKLLLSCPLRTVRIPVPITRICNLLPLLEESRVEVWRWSRKATLTCLGRGAL